ELIFTGRENHLAPVSFDRQFETSMRGLCLSSSRENGDRTQRNQYNANYKIFPIRFHLSLLLSCKDTSATCAEGSSVVGIDRRGPDGTNCPTLGLRSNCGVPLPYHTSLEDTISLSDG